MLKLIGIGFIAGVGLLLAIAATRPDTFRVQRTTSVKAPQMKRSYSGAASGKGAIEITDTAAPSRVTWALQGPVPYLARLVHLFLDMDAMVGRDFDAGLASLKSIAEKP